MKQSFRGSVFYLLLLLILGFVAVFLTGCEEEPETIVEVPQEDLSVLQEVSASGEIVPQKWAVLTFPSGGYDLTFNVKEGDLVVQNQELVTSTDQLLLSQLFQAEAALIQAKNSYDQLVQSPTKLALANAQAALLTALAYQEQIENINESQAQLDAAQADVDRLRIQLGETRKGASDAEIAAAQANLKAAEFAYESAKSSLSVAAPFNGEVIAVHANNNESIAAFQPVITIADLSEFRIVTTDLSEVDVVRLSTGLQVNFVLDAYPSRNFTGRIDHIAQKSSGGSAVYYSVSITMDEPPDDLRWGMTAFITIPNE